MKLPSIKKIKVLAIDDSELILKQLNMLMTQLGLKFIHLFTCAKQAIEEVQSGIIFDIIFIDLVMPELDGIEVIRRLAHLNFKGGIVLLSGEDRKILKTAENLAQIQNLNVIGVIKKPISKIQLSQLLQTYSQHNNKTQPNTSILVTVDELKRAIKNREIYPYYQAKLSIKKNEIVDAEALARWLHPVKGTIMPKDFIELAEQNNLINSLSINMVHRILNDVGRWHKQGKKINISINLSTDSLSNLDLPEYLVRLANKYLVPIKCITIEITESKLMQNFTVCLDALLRLRLKGFNLSIDDFGTGFSSISLLSQIPFTELKIDRAFVNGCSSDIEKRAIVESNIELAKKLDLITVAEGIENPDDVPILLNADIDYFQGYLVSKPLPANEFEALI